MSVFEGWIRGRNVIVHSDNMGAQHVTQKGIAKSWVHTCIVHSIWYEDCLAAFPMMLLLCARACRLRALELEMGLWISRVPSEDNIADDPSREEYEVLRALKAVRIEPRMHPKFLEFKAWDVISLRSESPMASIPVEDEVVCDLLF